ncbi:unnamed protein product [Rotaria socialis]|uniref:Uncharacterized protein n=1 Tax=Rotaria socialis TaxID=392032 RepID=A0A820PD30_9BILA|nr:unnamed protein product [Rotaria socialis]
MNFKVVSSESTNIDLNTRLVQPEQNLVGSGRFLCNQSYINKGTIEQENQQQTTSGQHANAYEIFNSCKELSMGNITIEDQSNIGSSTLNKVGSEVNVNAKSRKTVISNRKNLKRHRSSSRRSSKRFSTLSSCNGEKSTLNAADDTQLINTFVNGSKYEDLYVTLNDLSVFFEKHACISSYGKKESGTLLPTAKYETMEIARCESLFDTIQILRKSIKNHAHLFTMLGSNRMGLADFDSSMFWNYVPTILKIFIGMVTMSHTQFNQIKKILSDDIFVEDPKRLKIASISYDIINATNKRFVTPTHYLLGNERMRHE